MDDWIAALPREKARVFDAVVGRWECGYAMMSVALNDALTLRARGDLVCTHQQVLLAASLFRQATHDLADCCDLLARNGRRINEIPRVEPLRPRFFRGDAAQSAASWNAILHSVFLGDRARFFRKLRILAATLRELDQQFARAALDLAARASTEPRSCWVTFDSLHYDFNTCLREAEIVLKSYLRALPSAELPAIAEMLGASKDADARALQPGLSAASA